MVAMVVPLPGRSLFWSSLQNSGHCLLFAVLTLLGLLLLPSTRGKQAIWIRATLIASAVLCFGILMEFVQAGFGRSASLADIILDAYGVLAGLLMFASLRIRRCFRAPLMLAALLIFVWCFLPPMRFAIARYHLPNVPELARFEAPMAKYKLRASNNATVTLQSPPDAWNSSSSLVLKTTLGPGIYPGVRLLEPPTDWTGFDYLQFEAFHPGDAPLMLAVRLDDRHDKEPDQQRYTRHIRIAPGVNVVRIPLPDYVETPHLRNESIKLDLSKVTEILVYLSDTSAATTLYFDGFLLSGSNTAKPAKKR